MDAQEEAVFIQKLENGNRNGRELSSAAMAHAERVSESTIQRILKRNGFNSCKRTMKPILTGAMIEARLAFATAHAHWTLEDWKNVI